MNQPIQRQFDEWVTREVIAELLGMTPQQFDDNVRPLLSNALTTLIDDTLHFHRTGVTKLWSETLLRRTHSSYSWTSESLQHELLASALTSFLEAMEYEHPSRNTAAKCDDRGICHTLQKAVARFLMTLLTPDDQPSPAQNESSQDPRPGDGIELSDNKNSPSRSKRKRATRGPDPDLIPRNAWMIKRRQEGVTWSQIRQELETNEFKDYKLESTAGMIKAVRLHAQRTGQPVPRPRKQGPPPKPLQM